MIFRRSQFYEVLLLLVAKMKVGFASLFCKISFYKIGTAFDVFTDRLDETISVNFTPTFMVAWFHFRKQKFFN